jgi:hypothetical protein
MAAFYTLLYNAPLEAAEAIAFDEEAQDRWPSVWLKHIGDLELVALWEVIGGSPSASGGTLMANLVFQGSEEGPFVMSVPPEFITAVASIPDHEASNVAATWGQIEELADWQKEELVSVLNDLRNFAKQALASGQPVLQIAEL